MIIWVLDSESGVKLLSKSFLDTSIDEDIVSGFLTAFHHFSMEEFDQSLESIEMGGLKWIYAIEPKYNLLFVAADKKSAKTEILMGRLNVIKKEFVKEYKEIWFQKGESWDGNINIFLPFKETISDYYEQWEKVKDLSYVADFFDVLGVFQHIFIMLNIVIGRRMYSKSRNQIMDEIDKLYNDLSQNETFKDKPELKHITFSKDSWFTILDTNLIKCDKELVITYLKSLLVQILKILQKVKGKRLCFKYFSEEKIYTYLFNNLSLLKDLKLDLFLFRLFLLL
ncbi:MAG: hypothetical protein P8Y70_08425 [Candidatus Lokiarchaeota archaeon]